MDEFGLVIPVNDAAVADNGEERGSKSAKDRTVHDRVFDKKTGKAIGERPL
jgi:hypothetical protein